MFFYFEPGAGPFLLVLRQWSDILSGSGTGNGSEFQLDNYFNFDWKW